MLFLTWLVYVVIHDVTQDWRDLASIDDFSLSPLSYVTAVGEHLLTIPQQLEPFITASMADGGDNTSVGGGVGATDYLMVALEMGHLPVCLVCGQCMCMLYVACVSGGWTVRGE